MTRQRSRWRSGLVKPKDSPPAVLDATAIVAILFGEPGSERVLPLLQNAVVSAVNLAEVHIHLLRRGVKADLAWKGLQDLGVEVFPFDAEQARLASEIEYPALPLGDRACLALAILRKATVYTTDQAWKDLDLGMEVVVVGNGLSFSSKAWTGNPCRGASKSKKRLRKLLHSV